jgi:hypothetical protein
LNFSRGLALCRRSILKMAGVARNMGFDAQHVISVRAWRGIIHSSHGGRKAYLNFELKDRDGRRPRAFGASLTSKFR